MTESKMRKIIVGCVCAGTLFLFFLLSFPLYQWIKISKYNDRIDKLEKEIVAMEQMNAEMKDELSFLESDMGKDWLAFEVGFVRENK